MISGPSSTTYPQELAQSQSQSPHFRVSTVSADQSVVEIQRPHQSIEHKVFAIAEAILEIIANDKSQVSSLDNALPFPLILLLTRSHHWLECLAPFLSDFQSQRRIQYLERPRKVRSVKIPFKEVVSQSLPIHSILSRRHQSEVVSNAQD